MMSVGKLTVFDMFLEIFAYNRGSFSPKIVEKEIPFTYFHLRNYKLLPLCHAILNQPLQNYEFYKIPILIISRFCFLINYSVPLLQTIRSCSSLRCASFDIYSRQGSRNVNKQYFLLLIGIRMLLCSQKLTNSSGEQL